MLGLGWSDLFKGLAAVLCALGVVSLALLYFFPAPPSTISMGVGFKGGSYELLAARYQEILARSHMKLELRNTASGSMEHFKLLEDQNSGVPTAMAQGGVSDSEHAPGLLSLGSINYQIFCVFYRATEVLDDLTELKGKRIAVGPVGSGGRLVAEKVLGISGVTSENTTLLPFPGQVAVNALNDGRADAAIGFSSLDSPLIQSLLRDSRVRLMSVTRAEALTRVFPFLVRLVLPQGAIDFERKIPASDLSCSRPPTRGRACRSSSCTYQSLGAGIKGRHDKPGLFQRANEFPTLPDPEFPMAEGAVDFYKNGPSFLNRYLPFWMVSHVQRLFAVLLAGGVIIYPLFNFAPKLYRWFLQDRMRKLYRRLRIVEKALKENLSVSQLTALQGDMETIDRVSAILPMRHSETYFGLKRDIDATRTYLASRLVEARSQTANAA